MESRQIYNLIRYEQPQTVALMLSYTGAEKAAEVLAFFQAEQRERILERVATLAPTPVEIVEKVVEVLVAKMAPGRIVPPPRGSRHPITSSYPARNFSTKFSILEKS